MDSNLSQVKRPIGNWHLLSMVIGSMIGTGIFLFASPVCAYLLEPWAIICSWAIGSAIALSGAYCLAELCSFCPHPGGIYDYLRMTFGSGLSFMYAWAKFLVMGVGCLSIAALASAKFLIQVFDLPADAADEVVKPVALGMVCFITLMNILGPQKKRAFFQSSLTIPKIICLTVIILLGFFYFFHLDELEPAFLSPQLEVSQFQNPSLFAFLSALVPILWAFGGWEDIAFLFIEKKVPKKNSVSALKVGVLVVSILYLLINISYLLILTPLEIASAGSSALLLVNKTLGQLPGSVVSFFLMVVGLGVVDGAILSGARVPFIAGTHNLVFKWFCNMHPQTKTPQRALIMQGVFAIIVLYLSDDMISLLLWTSMPYWGFLFFLGPCVLILRGKHEAEVRPNQKNILRNIPAIFFTCASFFLFCFTVLKGFKVALPTVVLLLLGMVVFIVQRHITSLRSVEL